MDLVRDGFAAALKKGESRKKTPKLNASFFFNQAMWI